MKKLRKQSTDALKQTFRSRYHLLVSLRGKYPRTLMAEIDQIRDELRRREVVGF